MEPLRQDKEDFERILEAYHFRGYANGALHLYADAEQMPNYEQAEALIDDWIDYYNNDRYQWDWEKLSPNEYCKYYIVLPIVHYILIVDLGDGESHSPEVRIVLGLRSDSWVQEISTPQVKYYINA